MNKTKPCNQHSVAMKQCPEMWGMLLHGVRFRFCEDCGWYETIKEEEKKEGKKKHKRVLHTL